MKLQRSPLSQNRWIDLAEAPFGARTAQYGGPSSNLEFVEFGVRGPRYRYRVRVDREGAKALRDWLDECLRKDGVPSAQHPLVVELFKRLPPPVSQWPVEQRAHWLKAAAAIFNLLYGRVGAFELAWSPDEEEPKG